MVWVILGIGICTIFNIYSSAKNPQELQKEVTTLQQIKEAVLEKYVPDSLKDASRDASHDLMYAEPDGNDYWAARGTINKTESYIKSCKPCMYVDSLLKAKEKELEALSKGKQSNGAVFAPFFVIQKLYKGKKFVVDTHEIF
ncbi:MAG: hypothetical protein WC606_00765 [Candidatus Absconditabacterales bacterium]